ncbi:MAG: hypothetical protein BGO59_04570 [Spirosoma sp. 48-14]|nr:MAG: hypothetical protein BGO59_04570 [Spirosoma sp. 48-14]
MIALVGKFGLPFPGFGRQLASRSDQAFGLIGRFRLTKGTPELARFLGLVQHEKRSGLAS